MDETITVERDLNPKTSKTPQSIQQLSKTLQTAPPINNRSRDIQDQPDPASVTGSDIIPKRGKKRGRYVAGAW
jgi:hypothetical protein